jgi:hypothetical protein
MSTANVNKSRSGAAAIVVSNVPEDDETSFDDALAAYRAEYPEFAECSDEEVVEFELAYRNRQREEQEYLSATRDLDVDGEIRLARKFGGDTLLRGPVAEIAIASELLYHEYFDDDDDTGVALRVEQRRARGIQSPLRGDLCRRLTDNPAHRPKLTAGIAHDEAEIRRIIECHAAGAEITFEELVAPARSGRPDDATRVRLEVLGRAVSELRERGAATQAIANVIGGPRRRVTELSRRAA